MMSPSQKGLTRCGFASTAFVASKGSSMMTRIVRLFLAKGLLIIGGLIVLESSTPRIMAIPAFARKYKTACATCHSNWPELNDFGRAFKINGFKFPKDDEQFLKEPPLLLGAQAQKESFPKSIYPGELPILPIAFRYEGYITHTSEQPAEVTAASGYIPPWDLFAPNTFTIIGAGALGPSISFWIDDDLSTGGSGADGGLGDGYIKANNFLGHAFHIPQNDLNVRFGQYELDLPFTQARSINLTDYAIYDQTANVESQPGTVANPFAFADGQRGIEFGGFPNRGYTWWSVAVINGADGSGTVNAKDVYAHFSQRFDLERNSEVRKEVQASDQTGVHDHTSIRFDGFAYYGRSEQNQAGDLYPGLPTIVNPFYRVGGAFDYKFRSRFNLWGLYMHGHDDNKVLSEDGASFVSATPVTYSGGFVEAEYWFYPWLIGLFRYDGVNSPTDRINGISRYDTRNDFVPGLQIIARPNIKLQTEYLFNYEQPIPDSTKYYRANLFLTGVDFLF
jgi:hypothetical protein